MNLKDLAAAFLLINLVNSLSAERYENSVASEQDLYRYLFSGQTYDKLLRPVEEGKSQVTVYVGINPIMIQDYSFEFFYMNMNVSLVATWKDEYLNWSPDYFGRIKYLTLPLSSVWSPDLSIISDTTPGLHFPIDGTNVVLRYDGMVFWVSHPLPLLTIKNSCPEFKDAHAKKSFQCKITLLSYKYHNSQIKFEIYKEANQSQIVEPKSLVFYHDGAPYKVGVQTGPINTGLKAYSCCPDSYPYISFSLLFSKQ